MSEFISLPAPAKLNLMLNITGRRDDGYHLLQTVFRLLDFGDVIRFRVLDGSDIIRSQGNASIAANDDLIVAAARALQPHVPAASPAGAEIQLEKNIPLGAGLGGGSSDAASTLHALNRLWGCGLNVEQLAEIGLQLGADVPVFIHGQSAFAEGVGEILSPIELAPAWYLMVTPQVHVSTAEIFNASELTRDCPALKICDLLRTAHAQNGGESRGKYWGNVCTPVVRARYPEVDAAFRILDRVGEARMSGTGATVFVEFVTEQQVEQAKHELADRLPGQWNVVIARGIDASPVLRNLQQ